MAAAVLPIALEVLIAQEVVNNLVGQLVGQTISAALAPEFALLQQESWKFALGQAQGNILGLPLDPATLADAVVRGHRGQAQAQDDANRSGLGNLDFQTLVDNTGEPPPILTLTEAWRRGIIAKAGAGAGATSLEQGIRESRLKDKWTPVIEALQFQLPPVGTIIEGWLRAQLTEAEAQDLLYKSGVDKDTGTLMFKAAGRPPSPEELFRLYLRGVIPKDGRGGDTLSLEQGYLETDLKDKWYQPWTALAEYRPPPRTITALQRAGAITDAQALKLYKEEGLSDELAAIYVKTAHHERSATTRELTKAELVSLYVDQAITADDLKTRLLKRGYTAEDVALEVELADLKVEHALEQRAVNRVGSLYIGRRIDKAQALTSLQSLKLPPPQRDRLLKVWSLERADNLKHLTSTVLAWAVKETLMAGTAAVEELTRQGYGPRDAWLELSYHLKAPVTPAMPTDNLPPA